MMKHSQTKGENSSYENTVKNIRKNAERETKRRDEIARYHRILEECVSRMKETAVLEKEYAINMQISVESALKRAEDTKTALKRARVAFINSEKLRGEPPLPESGTSYLKMQEECLECLSSMKKTAVLEEDQAINMQITGESAIKRAEDVKTTAEKALDAFTYSETLRGERPLLESGMSDCLMLKKCLNLMVETAVIGEEFAINVQKNVVHAIKRAEDVKTATEKARRAIICLECERRQFPSLERFKPFHKMKLEECLNHMEQTSILGEAHYINLQISVEREIKRAEDAKITAERARSSFFGIEKARCKSFVIGGDTSHHRLLEECLCRLKETAVLEEEYAINMKTNVECAIKRAEDAKNTAERARNIYIVSERANRNFPLRESSESDIKLMENCLSRMEEAAAIGKEHAISIQKYVERAIKRADDAKNTVVMARKAFIDAKKARREDIRLFN